MLIRKWILMLSLIDTYLPSYTFSEYHEIVIRSQAQKVYECAMQLDFSHSAFIRLLFKIRGLPTRKMTIEGFVSDAGFTMLEENPPEEFLVGFWAGKGIQSIPCLKAFKDNTISPWIKVVWNFKLIALENDQIKLSTETRVLCIGTAAKIGFGLYWMLIRFFSGEIRKIMLRLIKESAQTPS